MNFIYVNKLAQNHDIVFLQELWTKTTDNLTEIIRCKDTHFTYHKAAEKATKKEDHMVA